MQFLNGSKKLDVKLLTDTIKDARETEDTRNLCKQMFFQFKKQKRLYYALNKDLLKVSSKAQQRHGNRASNYKLLSVIVIYMLIVWADGINKCGWCLAGARGC